MANEDKTLELIEKMYLEFSKRFEKLEQDNKDIKNDYKDLRESVNSIHKTVIRIENNHGEKLDALFDGYKQNAERLDRIEKEVSRHDEMLLRKIK